MALAIGAFVDVLFLMLFFSHTLRRALGRHEVVLPQFEWIQTIVAALFGGMMAIGIKYAVLDVALFGDYGTVAFRGALSCIGGMAGFFALLYIWGHPEAARLAGLVRSAFRISQSEARP